MMQQKAKGQLAQTKWWQLRSCLGKPARKILPHLPRPVGSLLYSLGRGTIWRDPRKPLFRRVFAEVSQSTGSGDYLEFGVFLGGSLLMAYNMSKKFGLDTMRFFAFDSFKGLPEDEGGIFQKGDFSQASEEWFMGSVRNSGMDMSRLFVVNGWFNETLNQNTKNMHTLRRAAVIHVDCDVYVSAKEVFPFVEDLVCDGTILILDDWFSYGDTDEFGERRAFREWSMSKNFHELVESPPHSKAFVYRASE